MSSPRRRIVRPAPQANPTAQQRQRRTQTLRNRMVQERTALGRWMSRLKRAFHAVEKLQQRVARLDRRLLGGTLMARVIEVVVSPKGESTVQTKGYAGADCLQASKYLEQALGVASTDRKTGEFFLTKQAEQHVQQ